jgi:hypothetical protein
MALWINIIIRLRCAYLTQANMSNSYLSLVIISLLCSLLQQKTFSSLKDPKLDTFYCNESTAVIIFIYFILIILFIHAALTQTVKPPLKANRIKSHPSPSAPRGKALPKKTGRAVKHGSARPAATQPFSSEP